MADWWLGEETIGELISRARDRLGKSQYALAEVLREASGRSDGVPDRSMVARWETGRRIPTPYWRAHLATVLQLPAGELDSAAAVTKARRASYPESVDALPSSERLRHALAHPGSADLMSVAYLREQVCRLDEQYDRAPSTALIADAGQYLGQISFLGAHARRSYVRRELYAAEAEAATLMGQLVWDASQRRDHDTAIAYFDQALHAAQEPRPPAAAVAGQRRSAGHLRPHHGLDGRLGRPAVSTGIDAAKQAVRTQVWDLLERERAVEPGVHGYIPAFAGAEAAADRLAHLPVWQAAQVIKSVPDRAQQPVRERALQDGKLLYMAVPMLADDPPFYVLDPGSLTMPASDAAAREQAASVAPKIAVDKMRPIDVVVCGSVAVNRQGVRLGKGAGYSDIEVALLQEAGLIGPSTVIVTTVHRLQVVNEALPETEHDFSTDLIVTPDEVIECGPSRRPSGLYWEHLTEDKIAAIPVLATRAAAKRG
jgi:5-formyltetrahydrofolate cyclo-ligase